MAISKGQRKAIGDRPDEAAFTRLITQGLADRDAVVDAYEHVFGEWVDAGGQPIVDMVSERPLIDPDEFVTVGALLIRRNRERAFKGSPAAPNIQEEA